ncbi:MAG: type IV toxin-antitoxin system AbiEi family antitoxin [Microbacterium sp.]
MHPAFLYLPGDRLSLTELSAARLDGDVIELGECYIPADLVEGQALRASTIAALIPEGTAASGPTAAWIHGAGSDPPVRHHVRRTTERRLRQGNDVRLVFHDRRVDPDDLSMYSGVAVTTPARTLSDLLLGIGRDPSLELWARLLAVTLPDSIQSAGREITALSRVPGRRTALAVLADLGFRTT